MEIDALPHQVKLLNSKAPGICMLAGMGAGKSFSGALYLIVRCLTYPKMNFMYLAPTHSLIQSILFPLVGEILDETSINYVIKKQAGEIHFDNGSKILCRSMDAPEKIIGFTIGDFVADEIDVMPYAKAMEAWQKAMARLRQPFPDGKVNQGVSISTPEGFKFTYEMFVKNKPPEYELIRARTYDNPHLPPTYIENLKMTFPANLIDAYLNGMHVNMEGDTVYTSFDRESDICTTDRELTQNDKTIHIGMDFNVTKCASVIYIFEGGILYAVDEIHSALDTPEMIELFDEKYDTKSKVLFPDSSGANRESVDASKSDLTLLRKVGTINAPNKNGRVKDRVMSVNKALETGKLVINVEKCPELVSCIEKQVYDSNGKPKKDHKVDHLLDAMGYPCVRLMPIVTNKATITPIRMW